jgi:hypothetical protein
METPLFEQIAIFLPSYLSSDEQNNLFAQLKEFPHNKNFYLPTSSFPNDVLQGDGWKGFIAINFDTTEKKAVTGIVLSNSCDIDPANKRDHPPNILFAPIISLQKYAALLFDSGKNAAAINDKLSDIRAQKTTSIFYLPEFGDTIGESIVLLDDVHRHPAPHFYKTKRNKIFTLNQYAFYIFLIKLSIHLTRLGERVHRVT